MDHEWIRLWPERAPLARGGGAEDTPAIKPYLQPAGNGGGHRRGLVIVCPGGGYVARADYEGEPIAEWLNSIGIPAVVLRYRVRPYRYPAALLDVQRAIRYVRHHASEWGIDGGKIGVLGFSAGGHLAASASTQYDGGAPEAEDPIERHSSRPDAAILCYPVITTRPPYGNAGVFATLLGERPDPAELDVNSCEERVTPDTPPAFLWHTADDEAVHVQNSLMYASALSRAGVPFDLHVYQSGPHGMALAERDPHVAGWKSACEHWLLRNGF